MDEWVETDLKDELDYLKLVNIIRFPMSDRNGIQDK